MYTTRPIREGERDGVEYYFVTEARLAELEAAGKVIEKRVYQTVHIRGATLPWMTVRLTWRKTIILQSAH